MTLPHKPTGKINDAATEGREAKNSPELKWNNFLSEISKNPAIESRLSTMFEDFLKVDKGSIGMKYKQVLKAKGRKLKFGEVVKDFFEMIFEDVASEYKELNVAAIKLKFKSNPKAYQAYIGKLVLIYFYNDVIKFHDTWIKDIDKRQAKLQRKKPSQYVQNFLRSNKAKFNHDMKAILQMLDYSLHDIG